MRQNGGNIPIAVVEYDFKGVAAAIEQTSDWRAVGIGDGTLLHIGERLRQIAVTDSTDVALRGQTALLENLRQMDCGAVARVERGIVRGIFANTVIAERIEGLIQEPFVDALVIGRVGQPRCRARTEQA